MRIERTPGQIQPGINWGIFTLRIPFLHLRPAWPEFFQGAIITTAIGFTLVPILEMNFGLSRGEALGMCLVHALLISWSALLYGEPFIAGWITPAVPFLFAFMLGPSSPYQDPTVKFQAMTAMSIEFALLTAFLGFTGLGKRVIALVPFSVKAGVMIGAALAALKRIFVDEFAMYMTQPWAMSIALIVSLVILFSLPFDRLKGKYPAVARLASFGFLPGLVIAAIVGALVGELKFNIEWGFTGLPMIALWQKTSPFVIGWPPLDMFLDKNLVTIVFIAYIAVFGDMITGIELTKDAQSARDDEKIDINNNRSHFVLAIRNFIMALLAPFFATQGFMWTGTQVLILKRWREGRAALDSVFSGIASFTTFGIPAAFFILPVITLLEPLLNISLNLTLLLTAFACASVALRLVHQPLQLGVALTTAFTLVFFKNPWIGVVVGVVAALVLIGVDNIESEREV